MFFASILFQKLFFMRPNRGYFVSSSCLHSVENYFQKRRHNKMHPLHQFFKPKTKIVSCGDTFFSEATWKKYWQKTTAGTRMAKKDHGVIQLIHKLDGNTATFQSAVSKLFPNIAYQNLWLASGLRIVLAICSEPDSSNKQMHHQYLTNSMKNCLLQILAFYTFSTL